MTRTGDWKVRGVASAAEREPVIEELQARIDELEYEADWQNAWNTELLNIAVRHARDADELREDIAAAKARATQGRATGSAANRDRADERRAWFAENKPKALAETKGNRENAKSLLRLWMLDWARANPGQKAWSAGTIRNEF